MRVHWLQHADFEGLGSIEGWLAARGHTVSGTRLQHGETLPEVVAFDVLIVMGGPMGVYDVADNPWIPGEIESLSRRLAADRPTLGICLGAQMVAAALGSAVYKGDGCEIGCTDGWEEGSYEG
jgi:GMP synthase-like glutamine amidotransferase